MTSPQTFVYKHASGVDIHADVYLPSDESRNNLPILIWIHGGGCLMSSRTEGTPPHLKRAVSVVEVVEDVRDSGKWARETLPTLLPKGKVDPSRLAVGGGSAGGYLAVMAAHPTLGMNPPPKAVLALYPITNPRGPFFKTPVQPACKPLNDRVVSHDEMAPHVDPNAAVLSSSSPPSRPPPPGDRQWLYFYMVQEAILEDLLFKKAPAGTKVEDYILPEWVSKDTAPIWVHHGVVDTAVGIEQARSLVEAMKAKDVTHEYHEDSTDYGQHLFDQMNDKEELETMYAFMKKFV